MTAPAQATAPEVQPKPGAAVAQIPTEPPPNKPAIEPPAAKPSIEPPVAKPSQARILTPVRPFKAQDLIQKEISEMEDMEKEMQGEIQKRRAPTGE